MANAADYQHSGTEPLRSNPQTFRAAIIPDPTNGKNTIPAQEHSGTEQLRTSPVTMKAAIPSTPSKGQSNTPPKVDSFKDNCV